MNFNIDVVLVSDAKNSRLKSITQMAIDTVGNIGRIIIVESNPLVSYENAIMIYPDQPFSYNAYLNIGANRGTAEYIFFGNNDIFFSKDWAVNLISELEKENVVSASPVCPRIASLLKLELYSGNYFGYDLISKFCGWAFVWKRSFYESVGGLDEDFKFWCSDNATVEQLINNNEKHILVTSSIVEHIGIGRNTLNLLDKTIFYDYTFKEIEKFQKKFNKKIMNSDHFKLFNKK